MNQCQYIRNQESLRGGFQETVMIQNQLPKREGVFLNYESILQTVHSEGHPFPATSSPFSIEQKTRQRRHTQNFEAKRSTSYNFVIDNIDSNPRWRFRTTGAREQWFEARQPFPEQRAMDKSSQAATSTSFTLHGPLVAKIPPERPFFEITIPRFSSFAETFLSIGKGIPVFFDAVWRVWMPSF